MSIIGKFAGVGSATMASRILGFVREVSIAAFLGTGPVADAFYAALRFPNLFRRLFAEGAFNAAFIPLFAKRLEDDEKSAQNFANEVFSVLVVILAIFSTLAIIAMPWLTGTIIAPSFQDNPEKFELTVFLTRIMFPYLAAMSLVAMLSGVLNALRKYFLAALVPVLLNIGLIAALGVSYASQFDQNQIGIALAISVTLSGVAQLSLLLWAANKEGFLPQFQTPKLTQSVKRLLWLALPAAITGGITQINLLVGQIIASAQDGAIAVINYADRLMQLPLGVIGIAIGVVLLPELSRALKAGQQQTAQNLQNRSLEFALFMTLPAAVGLYILAEPIIYLLFERGAFDRKATVLTASVLSLFAIGLPAFVISKVFTPAYYVRENMRWPMWSSLASVVANIAGSLILFPKFGVIGIAIATAISGWINMLFLMLPLLTKGQYRPARTTIKRSLAIALASIVMGANLYLAEQYFGIYYSESGFWMSFITLVPTIMCAKFLYFICAIAFSGMRLSDVKAMIKRQ